MRKEKVTQEAVAAVPDLHCIPRRESIDVQPHFISLTYWSSETMNLESVTT